PLRGGFRTAAGRRLHRRPAAVPAGAARARAAAVPRLARRDPHRRRPRAGARGRRGARRDAPWRGAGGARVSETSRAQDAIAAFAGIASALAESLEMPEVLHRIASTVLVLSGADSVSVLLRRGGEAEFVAHERSVGGPRMRPGFRFPVLPEVVAALEVRLDPLVILGMHASPLVP